MADDDCVKLTVPLFIRLLEYAREDAKDDMALHELTERLMECDDVADMDDYDELVGESEDDDDKDEKPRKRSRYPKIAKRYVK